MRDPAHTKSVGLLLGAALCWSLAGILFKHVEWPGLAAAGGRGLIAALFLLAVSWRSLRFTWSRLQISAAVAYAACTILFALANKLTTAANAILLQYLLGTWFLAERPTRADWLTIVVVFGGLALFFYEGLQLNNVAGLLVALASGLAFAIMTLLMRKQKDTSPLESIILGNLLGFCIGVPALWSAPALPASGWIALGLLGTVQLGLAYLLYAKAIRHVTALQAVLIPVLEPLLNPLWVLLADGERPGIYALAGGLLVLGAITLRAIFGIRAMRATP